MEASRASFDVQEHGAIGLVTVRGELSVYEANELRDVLRTTVSRNEVTLVDLTRTDFMDATALGVLVGALKVANGEGNHLEVIAPVGDGAIRKILRITGIGKLFVLHASVPEALAKHGVTLKGTE